MPLTINDTSYVGDFAKYFWLPATFEMDSIAKGVLYVKDGIKKQHTIGRIDFNNPLQARAATPTSSGTFVVDGRTLTPADVMVYTEFNPRQFEEHFLAEQLSRTLLARELPVTAENYMMQLALNRTMEQTELGIWMGSTGYTALTGSSGNGQLKFYDGFIRKMVLDAAVQKVASPFALTAGASSGSAYNVGDAMDALIALAITNKKALMARPSRFQRMKFLMSVNSEQIYLNYLASLQQKGTDPSSGKTNPWKGFQVVSLAGLPDNTIVFAEAIDDTTSNLYLGMNSTDDNLLELKQLQANSELWFIKGLMKYDVEYGWSEEVFLFTTLVSGTFTA